MPGPPETRTAWELRDGKSVRVVRHVFEYTRPGMMPAPPDVDREFMKRRAWRKPAMLSWPMDPRNRKLFPLRGGSYRDEKGEWCFDAFWEESHPAADVLYVPVEGGDPWVEPGPPVIELQYGRHPSDGRAAFPFWDPVGQVGNVPDGDRVWQECKEKLDYPTHVCYLAELPGEPRRCQVTLPDGTEQVWTREELDAKDEELRAMVVREVVQPSTKPPGRPGAERRRVAARAIHGRAPIAGRRAAFRGVRDPEDVWVAMHWLNERFAEDVSSARRELLTHGDLSDKHRGALTRRWPIIDPSWWLRCLDDGPGYSKEGFERWRRHIRKKKPQPGRDDRGRLLWQAWMVICNRRLYGSPRYREAIAASLTLRPRKSGRFWDPQADRKIAEYKRLRKFERSILLLCT